uniref:Uncharacterized protein n=1 Tax=Glossina brevipalpis TaxID=37001 RepID=A0A1A9WJ99_9MUSC
MSKVTPQPKPLNMAIANVFTVVVILYTYTALVESILNLNNACQAALPSSSSSSSSSSLSTSWPDAPPLLPLLCSRIHESRFSKSICGYKPNLKVLNRPAMPFIVCCIATNLHCDTCFCLRHICDDEL